MRKFIAASSVFMIVGFAMALANANDDMSSTASESPDNHVVSSSVNDSATTSDSGEQQAGTVGSSDVDSNHYTKTTKTCTDSAGVTYSRGKSGYNHCLDEMKSSDLSRTKDQMSGTAGKVEKNEKIERNSTSNFPPNNGD